MNKHEAKYKTQTQRFENKENSCAARTFQFIRHQSNAFDLDSFFECHKEE
jgi:hypothetical protein